MLDQKIRAAILVLRAQGHGTRAIARALKISRGAVRQVIRSGKDTVPALARELRAERWRDEILAQHALCKGNLIRVHEELLAKGATLSYPALTAFCRRHGIGFEPKKPAGRYEFAPGVEMQHDTSPHRAKIDGVWRDVQTASAVLGYSRLIFFQAYSNFTRFECKVFLADALAYFGGVPKRCVIDNTHVVVLKGSGSTMVPVPEMAAFSERYGFRFLAHEIGDADRSAKVEVGFDWIDNNFLAGRVFEDWRHMNREARQWCDQKNAAFSRKLHASRRELFAVEATHLQKLPIWVPEVYALHDRIVDAEGYVSVRGNRYSAPWTLLGRRLEVRETRDRIEMFEGTRQVACHERVLESADVRITEPSHRPPRGQGRPKEGPPPEEQELLKAEPALASYVAALRQRASGRGTLALRRLLRQLRDYPRAPFLAAVRCAEEYGLFDLDRLESMVLRQIARDFFVLPPEADGEDDDE